MTAIKEKEQNITQEFFDLLSTHDHEQVVVCNDNHTGLKAIIGIHNTVLGPGLGGTRMYPYKNDKDALIDVLRLSRGMSYKAAISGLNLGGGQVILIGDPNKHKSEAYFGEICQFIDNVNSKYRLP